MNIGDIYISKKKCKTDATYENPGLKMVDGMHVGGRYYGQCRYLT